MLFKDFLQFLTKENIKIIEKFGSEGKWNKVSLFGKGRYYEGVYKGIKFTFSPVVSKQELGIRIKFYFPHPLSLGLYGSFNTSFVTLKSESRSIFSKKIKSSIEELNIWAVKKVIAEKMFNDERFINSLNTILSLIKDKKSNFLDKIINMANYLIINDIGIVIFLWHGFNLNLKSLLGAMYNFVINVDNYIKDNPQFYPTYLP